MAVSTVLVVVGNGATWDRLEPKTEKQKSKIQKKIEFCFSNFVLG